MTTENYTDEDFSDEQDAQAEGSEERNDRKWVRDLEKRAKGADTAKAEAEAARRELAMLKAGIDLETPQGKLFAKAYDGESTLDAVKAAAEEYGVIQAMNAIPAEELDAIDRVSRAGAVPASTPMDDPLTALNNAETPDEIIQLLKKSGITIDNEQPGQWKSLV
jgi:hypothetical protein